MLSVASIEAIDLWDPERCLAFLETDGSEAPEYDLETAWGIQQLREDCKRKTLARHAA